MAMNLQAVVRIGAQVTGLDDLTQLEKGIGRVENAAGAAKNGFKAMIDSSAWQGAAVAAAALGTAIALSTKAAIDFESSLAEVRKVVNGLETAQGIRAIKNEIFELSRQMPITAKGFAEIYAAAGQAGIARQELQAFARDVGMVAVAFDMTAEEAGNALAKIRTSLGLSQPDLMDLADAMNYLSNNTASTAREITEFVLRTGTVGKTAGLSAQQTAAFGAAMIASGAQADVAATSFNNMIKALSRGDSMTERQVSALRRLGLAVTDAAAKERELTSAVERESNRRIEAARRETDQISKEINRRYRNQLQALQDSWDDERESYEDAIRDRADAQIKALQRQKEAELEARGEISRATRAAIEDEYDKRIELIRDAADDELKAFSRAQRDQQQGIRDALDDRKELELSAQQQRFKAIEQAELEDRKVAIERAKETARQIAGEGGRELSKRLQKDAVGTIRDVFDRIRKLPKEMQVSVISDLFGDEARALAPLIGNAQLLDKALGLVGDKSKYAGSTAKEYAARLATTANSMQLAQNNLEILAITFGEQFAPALNAAMQALSPILSSFTWMVQNIPGLGPVLAIVTTGFVGLVAVAPFLLGFITLLGQIKPILIAIQGTKFAATIAGWIGILGKFAAWFSATKFAALIAGWAASVGPALLAVKAAFIGFLGWLSSTLLPALVGFFSGPVGWTVLAVAAVVAMAVAFRKPISEFFVWLGSAIAQGIQVLWQWGEPIRQFWIGVWESIKASAAAFIQWLGQAWSGISKFFYEYAVVPIMESWTKFINWIQSTYGGIAIGFTSAWRGIVEFFVDRVVSPIQAVWGNFIQWLQQSYAGITSGLASVWSSVVEFFVDRVVQPLRNAWSGYISWLQSSYTQVNRALRGAWDGVTAGFINNIVMPLRNAWTGFTQWLQSSFNSLGNWISSAWNGVGAILGNNLVTPLRVAWGNFTEWFREQLTAVRTAFNSIWSGLGAYFSSTVIQPIREGWVAVMTFLPTVMRSVGQAIRSVLENIVTSFKNLVRSMLRTLASGFNSIIRVLNSLISRYNSIPGSPKLPLIGTISVPAYAEGGYVTKRTLAEVSEREPEYIIPESKMAAASANYLRGSRGADVIPSSSSATTPTRPATVPTINITTGPVMEFDGKRYVTLADFERGLRQTAEGVVGRLRTPAARAALGMR